MSLVVVVVAFATTLIVVELKESSRVCSSEVQKSRGGGKGERESSKVCSSEKGGVKH